jgi:hypothetical protein
MYGAAIYELMYVTDRAYRDAVTLPYATVRYSAHTGLLAHARPQIHGES